MVGIGFAQSQKHGNPRHTSARGDHRQPVAAAAGRPKARSSMATGPDGVRTLRMAKASSQQGTAMDDLYERVQAALA